MSLGPRSRHLLDQYMAYALEVQGKLRTFELDLVLLGYAKPEAWAIARDMEQRILGPVTDYAGLALPIEESVDELIRKRMEELGR